MEKYVVKNGDTLESISSDYFGDPSFWGIIFEANPTQIKDPDVLPEGVELDIPDQSDLAKMAEIESTQQMSGEEKENRIQNTNSILQVLEGIASLFGR